MRPAKQRPAAWQACLQALLVMPSRQCSGQRLAGDCGDTAIQRPRVRRRHRQPKVLAILVTGTIDIATIETDRDQLWAEALVLYRQGVRWWLPPTIEAIAAEQQAGFVEDDVLEGPIARWLTDHPYAFTLEDLFATDTGITPYRETTAVTKRDEMRAARCLTKLKLVRRRTLMNRRRAYWWLRK